MQKSYYVSHMFVMHSKLSSNMIQKVNFALEQAMKPQRGCRSIALLFL